MKKILAILLLACLSCAPVLAQETAPPVEDLDQALSQAKSYVVGGDFSAFDFIIEATLQAQGKPEAAKALADQLAAAMLEECTFDCKRNLARQLQIIAGEGQITALAPLLQDESCAHLVRYIFQAVPGAAVDAAFLKALKATSGACKVGLINTIANRNAEGAVDALSPLATDPDPAIAYAAIVGLGKTLNPKACEVLQQIATSATDPKLKAVALDAGIKGANALLEAGESASAVQILERLYREDMPKQVRRAAFTSLVKAGGAHRAQLIVETLKNEDPYWQLAAAAQVRRYPDAQSTALFAEALPGLSPSAQLTLILALGDRADNSAMSAIRAFLYAEDEDVQRAAISAAGQLGNARTAYSLAKIASDSTGALKRAARSSLYAIPDPEVSPSLAKRLGKGSDELQMEILRALSERNYGAALPQLCEMAKASQSRMQDEIYRSIGKVADPEAMPALLTLLIEAKDDRARKNAKSAIVATARRISDAAERPKALLAAMEQTSDPVVQAALLSAIGEIGGAEALPLLENALQSEEALLRLAALSALSDWADSTPMDTLLSYAKNSSIAEEKDTALDGYVVMLRKPNSKSTAEIIAAYRQVLDLSGTDDMKRRVISGLAEVKAPGALQMLQAYLADPAVKEEAQVAVDKIRKAFQATTASHQADRVGNATDGAPDTRWDTAALMSPGMWFQLDMKESTALKGITLDCTKSPNDYPRSYEIYVYDDPAAMGDPVATGAGSQALLTIDFAPKTGRYLLIIQTGVAKSNYWSIHELGLIQP